MVVDLEVDCSVVSPEVDCPVVVTWADKVDTEVAWLVVSGDDVGSWVVDGSVVASPIVVFAVDTSAVVGLSVVTGSLVNCPVVMIVDEVVDAFVVSSNNLIHKSKENKELRLIISLVKLFELLFHLLV